MNFKKIFSILFKGKKSKGCCNIEIVEVDEDNAKKCSVDNNISKIDIKDNK